MKDRRIEVKLTEEHYNSIKAKAESFQMAMSEYLLFCGMNASISCSVGGHFDKVNTEISFAHKMFKDGLINEVEYNRIKAGHISNFEKTTV